LLRAYRDEVLLQMEARRPLIDVRSPHEYRGKLTAPHSSHIGVHQRGHIPYAVNIPWTKAIDSAGNFRGRGELRAVYCDGHGIHPSQQAICYSQTGRRSSNTWFVLTYLLGYDSVKSYDGSWTEWGNLIGAPIER
jgi:thiosulfate/3-mercaptopyruvate sulfurtransferase